MIHRANAPLEPELLWRLLNSPDAHVAGLAIGVASYCHKGALAERTLQALDHRECDNLRSGMVSLMSHVWTMETRQPAIDKLIQIAEDPAVDDFTRAIALDGAAWIAYKTLFDTRPMVRIIQLAKRYFHESEPLLAEASNEILTRYESLIKAS